MEALNMALTSIKEMLQADGYYLRATKKENEKIEIFVEAGKDACSDCLVPKEVLESIVVTTLAKEKIIFNELIIHMPSQNR